MRLIRNIFIATPIVFSSIVFAGFDGDGAPDGADLDSDNDGIPDSIEVIGGTPVYFIAGSTTPNANVNSYSTSATGVGAFSLDAANSYMELGGNPTAKQPTTLATYPDALHYLEGSAAAFNPPGYTTATFTIDDSYPDFAGDDALFTSSDVFGDYPATRTDPDNGIDYTSNVDMPEILSFEADLLHLEFTTSFTVDDINNYGDFFLDHREYADASKIEIYVNGSLVTDLTQSGTTTNITWYIDPNPMIRTTLDKSVLNTGVNTVRFVVEDSGVIGAIGFAAFGRFGATLTDSDGDGTLNIYDLDSDNDGIPDLVEAGGVDADGNGIVDGFVDNNTDGLDDGLAAVPLSYPDHDADGTPDYLDPDSDNDGILDTVEGAVDTDGDGIANYIDIDSDNDGILDSIEGVIDTDGDGVPNALDLDSDNDGISDLYESGNAAGIAADIAGNANGTIDTGESADTDLDGLLDVFDDGNINTPLQSDGDSIPDYLDLDSDDDSIPDTVEARPTAGYSTNDGNVSNDDLDGDGIIALFDANDSTGEFGGTHTNLNAPVNTDGTGLPDYLDTDSDDDGVSDSVEGEATVAGGSPISTPPTYSDPDGSVNDPLSDIDGSDLLENNDSEIAEVDYRSDPPVATNAATTVAGDTVASIALAANISDASNDQDLTTIDLDPGNPGVQSTITTSDGVWMVDAAGLVTFDPITGFQGIATVPYTVQDANGHQSNSADISVTVNGALPVATADSTTVLADTTATVDLADNVSDTNNDLDITTIDLDPTMAGVQNTLTTTDGAWSVDAAGLVTFDPVPSFEGSASIPYTVEDVAGNVSLPANVSVTVGGATPVATADSATVLADTNATVDLADNVSDINNDVDITTIDLDPSNAGVQNTLTTTEGVWSVDAAGLVTFDPASTFEGIATIAYTVADDDGNTSASANVSVTVAGATPVATADSTTVLADTNATVDLADNVSDANNDIDIATIDLDPTMAGVQNSLTTTDGDWSVDAAGLVTFDPAPSFEGIASIPYTVQDDDGNVSLPANVSVTVSGAPPVATADGTTVLADTNATVDLADNVSDANNDVDITTIDLDSTMAGVQNTLTTAEGVWSVDAAGLVTFDPAPTFEGVATIPYTVEDDDGNVSLPANVSVTVGGATPVATADSTTVLADTIATVDLADNVSDANNDVDITTIDLDPTLAGVQNTLTTAEGVWSVDTAGLVTFDPASTFEGTASIPYTVEDDDGNASLPADVSVTVSGATPVATADGTTVLADTTTTVDLADNVSDANNDIDITTIDLDLTLAGVQNTLTSTDGVWSVDAAGLVTFDPASTFEGVASIPYTVEDDDGNVSLPADVSVTVGGATPVATADSTTVLADTNATVDLADNVSDANNDIDITTIDLDPTIAGVQNTLTTTDGVWSVDAAGLVTFDPVSTYEGTTSIPYTVEDDDGNVSLPANVSVTVGGATPVATADTATVTADSNASIDLADNITDANNDIDITTIDLDPTIAGVQNTLTTAEGVWSVDTAGLVTFDPAPSFEGIATIPYTVEDNDGNVSLPADVSVTVGGATPVATADSTTVLTDTNATIDLADNVSDANNDIDITTIDLDPSIAGVQNTLTTADGIWSVDAAGLVTFDPAPSFEGVASIPYTVEDDDANVSLPANVSVTVGGATPVATADSTTVLADTNATVDLADNVSDANNDIDITTIDLDPTLAGVQNTLTTADGVWNVDAAGLVTFDPASTFEGSASIPYTVEDDDGNVSLPANVSVTVGGATPVATADGTTVAADTNAIVDLADNVSDANNDIDIATIDLDPSIAGVQSTLTTTDGVWSVDAAGLVTFDPTAIFEGIASIPYTVEDDDGNVSLPATVSVTVSGAIPVTTVDSATVIADTNATVDLADNVSDANNDIDIATIDLDPTIAGVQNTITTADGIWSVDSAGLVTFDPAPSFEGVASIPYTVEDDDGNVSLPANVSVTVGGATPVATADSTTVLADINATIDLADNVSDANNDIDITTIDLDPTIAGVQNTLTTADGVWNVDAAGLVTFDPDSTFEGIASIPYTVEDDDGNVSLPADITVTVGGATPVATADSTTVLADTNAIVDLADNVSDANNDIDIATIDLDPSIAGVQNTLTTTDGVWSVDAAGLVTFDPAPSFEGIASIPYTVEDDDGNVSLPADVSVTVSGAIPVTTADSATALADTNATIDLADNVTDANNDVDIATIDLDPTIAGVQNTLTTTDGIWSVDAAGLVTFDPAPSFEGIASIPYTVEDDDGNVSLPADVSVTVAGATPVATADAATVVADAIASIDLTDNVSDANNDIDTNTIDLDPATPGIQNTVSNADGVWTVSPAGVVTFDPASTFEGNAIIAYTVEDDDGNVSLPADISVDVDGATPVATADGTTVLADTDATVDLADNVSDANNDVDITTIDLDPASAGNQNSLTTADGTWSVDAAGVVTFDPIASYEGTAVIEYNVSDDDGNVSPPAEIAVIVEGATPVADNDIDTIVQNTAVTIDVLAGDNDANNNIDASTIDLDPAAPGIQSTLTVAGEGNYEVIAGQVVFTPEASFVGTSSIAYTVADATGNTSNTATIDITVLLDTDADGTANIDDVDDDNDGIPDLLEGSSDTDGDGIIDSLDSDSDNDGITDATEAGGSDLDGDGMIDGFIDADGDGLDDATSASPLPILNSDGDALADYLDLDSDNDGLTDATEAGGIDLDGNGVIDNFVDTNNDGLDDALALTALPIADFDSDGAPDYLDLDSDNDGITDTAEAGGSDVNGDGIIDNFIDTDSDGLDDATSATPAPIADTDSDGNPDYLDLDSDNDGLSDTNEAGGVDSDGDGIVDSFTDANGDGLDDATQSTPLPVTDTDGDGTADVLDVDSDNDSIPDSVEAGSDPTMPIDTDADGIPDVLEEDSDNDGIPDSVEAGSDPTMPVDTDGDGTPDFIETDSDDDGIPDSIEAGSDPTAPIDSDGDGIANVLDPDSDNDGIPDVVEAGPSGLPLLDTDGDGIVDALDTDSDGDGIDDAQEGVVDTDGDGVIDAIDTDSDNDGVLDADEGTQDTDGDGVIDAVDSDSDNDGINDEIEGTQDTDGDGVIDALDIDSDNDGLLDSVETAIDSDGDGIPDYRDLDSDNDSLTDAVEAGGSDTDGNGIIDGFTDVDGDGWDDGVAAFPLPDNDFDVDGIVDHLDVDSDNDGLSDLAEANDFAADSDGDGRVDNFVDADSDGLDDSIAVMPVTVDDVDNDGAADHLDLDTDNDGVLDLVEAGGIDANNDGIVDILSDADADGIPDSVDVDLTLGADADADGIDDSADSDFNTGSTDTDGDGIIDERDPDVDGDGFANFLSDGSTVPILTAILDANNNGIPDVDEPGVGPVAEAANSGIIHTGLEGSGCSIGGSKEPLLPLLALASLLVLLRKRVSGLLALLVPVVVGSMAVDASSNVAIAAETSVLPVKTVEVVYPVPTFRNEIDDRFNRRFYAGFGLGSSWLEPDTSEVDGVDVNKRVDSGAQLMLGWDVKKWLSLELHATELGDAGLAPAGAINYRTFGGSALFYVGRNRHRYKRQGLSAYGRLGMGYLSNHRSDNTIEYAKDNATHAIFGLGLEYMSRRGLGIRAEGIYFDADVRYGQLSLLYRFGNKKDRAPTYIVEQRTTHMPWYAPSTAVAVVRASDSDQDGIADEFDSCLQTAPGVAVNSTGCDVLGGVLKGVTFATSSARLTDEATARLNEVVTTLKAYPDMNFVLSAHTDDRGSAKSNQALSNRRVVSVATYLQQAGIDPSRFQVEAFGESKPIASNKTAVGRLANRRVELNVVK